MKNISDVGIEDNSYVRSDTLHVNDTDGDTYTHHRKKKAGLYQP
jgi:hypothetical protein